MLFYVRVHLSVRGFIVRKCHYSCVMIASARGRLPAQQNISVECLDWVLTLRLRLASLQLATLLYAGTAAQRCRVLSQDV